VLRPLRHLLTPTQFTVARLIAQGWNNKEVSRLLHRSERTVERHTQDIYMRLGFTPVVNGRTALTRRFVYEEGFDMEDEGLTA